MNTHRFLSRPLCVLAAAALLSAGMLAPRQARADLSAALNATPSGAELVVIVPNLTELSDRIAVLKQEMGLPIRQLDNVLAALKRDAGMKEGLDDHGSLAFTISGLVEASEGTKRAPDFLLIVPVTDYAAFVGNFGGSGADEITKLTMPNGAGGFARKVGNFAVMGESEKLVTDYAAGNDAAGMLAKTGSYGKHYLDQSQLAVFIDIETIGPKLAPKIDEGVAQMAQMMEMMQQMQGGGGNPMVANAADMYRMMGEAAKAVLRDGKAAALALSISKDGLAWTECAGLDEGSATAKVFAGSDKSDTKSLLGRLPDVPYLYAMAMDSRGMDLAGLYAKFVEALPANDDAMTVMYKDSLPLVSQVQSMGQIMLQPDPNNMMGGMVNAVTIYETGDSKKFITDTKSYLAKINGLSTELVPAMGDQPAQTMTYTTTYQDNALQIEGAQVDQYSLMMNFPPEMQGMLGPMQMMLGGNGYRGYVAPSNNYVVLTTSTDPQSITAGLKAAKDTTGLGSGGKIAALRQGEMPDGLVAEGYVSLGGIAQTGNMFLAMFGGQPIAVPQDLPPLAMGMGLKDNSAAFRLFIPMETLKFTAGAVAQVQATFGGQGGGQGGPGGPPPF